MINFGPTVEITAGDLASGDWIDTIPTQRGVRGIRIQGIADQVVTDGFGWKQGNGRGRRSTPVSSVTISTRLGRFSIPEAFTLTVRRCSIEAGE
jgi:hypothetical protein